MEVTHGKEFLIDYYALLGIERDAEDAAIKTAYHEKQLSYHPDRYEGLAPELKLQAAEKSLLLAEAFATLSIRHNRVAYDHLLSGWTGPISTDGRPIIALHRPHFLPAALLQGDYEPDADEELLKTMMKMCGHDPTTLALLEKLHAASEAPNPALVQALQRALFCKETYLALVEGIQWQSAGFMNQPITDEIGLGHAASTEARLDAARAHALSGLDQTLAQVASGELKLLSTGGGFDPAAPDAGASLIRFREAAASRFEAAAVRIREAAQDRAANAAKALELVIGVYDPPEQALQPKLLMLVKAGDKETRIACKLEGMSISSGTEAPPTAEAIAAGYSIIRLEICEALEIADQLRKVMLDHFERWLAQAQET